MAAAPLNPRQRTASIATGSAAAAATLLLIGGMFVAWHTISVFGVDIGNNYPWGSKVTDPQSGCTEYGYWVGGETSNCPDEGSSSQEPQKAKDAETILKVQSYVLGVALIGLLAGSMAVLLGKTRAALGKVLLLVGAILGVAAFVLYVYGENMFYEALKEDANANGGFGALVANNMGGGLWMGAIGLVVALAAAIVVMILHAKLGEAAPAPPATAPPGVVRGARPVAAGPARSAAPARAPGTRAVLCPKCRSRVEVAPGAKPSCWNCGFGT